MASGDSEPRLGTAIKIIADESLYLGRFMKIVEKRMQLKEKHLDELKELRTLQDSWNSSGPPSALSHLTESMTGYFNQEISILEHATAEMGRMKREMPELFESMGPPETKIDHEELARLYAECQDSHAVVIQPEAGAIFDTWRRNRDTGMLPEIDRNYRKSVHKQHKATEEAHLWYTESVPTILERHQQRIEDIKSFSTRVLNSTRETSVALSTASSSAIHANKEINSVRLIDPLHKQVEAETQHIFLKPIEYRNYLQGGQVSKPIFGLGIEETTVLVTQIQETVASSSPLMAFTHWVDVAFFIEKELTEENSLPGLLQKQNRQYKTHLLIGALMMDEPLLPISRSDLSLYGGGIPRTKIKQLLERTLGSRRQQLMPLLVRLVTYWMMYLNDGVLNVFDELSAFLIRSLGCSGLLASLWRKWDAIFDQPFPDGVERRWNGEALLPEVVWLKSGQMYNRNKVKEASEPTA